MNTFSRDFKPRREDKNPAKLIITASIFSITLALLAVLAIIALPNAIDAFLGIKG